MIKRKEVVLMKRNIHNERINPSNGQIQISVPKFSSFSEAMSSAPLARCIHSSSQPFNAVEAVYIIV